MSSIGLSTRRPLLFTTNIGRRTKPPDSQSMIFAQVKNNLHQANYNQQVEKFRSQNKSGEIEDLYKQINQLKRERNQAIEESVHVKQEALRLSQSNERLQSQLLKAKSDKYQMATHIAELQFEHHLVRQEQANQRPYAKDLQKTSFSEEARCVAKYRERLRVATVLIGVLQCGIADHGSTLRKLENISGQQASMDAIVQALEDENVKLHAQHEADVKQLGESRTEREQLECELNYTRKYVKQLSTDLSGQEIINERMFEELKKFQLDQEGQKDRMGKLLKELQHTCEQEKLLGKQVEKMERSNKELVEAIQYSENQLRITSVEMETLKLKKKFSQEVETKVGELISRIAVLKDAYRNAIMRFEGNSTKQSNEEDIQKKRVEMQAAIEARRSIFNEIQEIRGNIRVFCRVRPSKKQSQAPSVITIPHVTSGNTWKMLCREKTFSFDRVFQEKASNLEVYEETAGVVETILSGSNVCIMAYGQTGSGKSYTMEGNREDPGVNVLALQHLFRLLGERGELSRVIVNVSVLEIYNDEIQDLLVINDGNENRVPDHSGVNFRTNVTATKRKSQKLQVRKVSPNSNKVHVPGVVKVRVSSVEDANRVMGKAKRRRSVSSTMMNSESSRSHLIVEVEVKKQERVTKLHLVDLAGSERVDRSKVKGARLREAIHINKSLSILGNVFSALENRQKHVPYRDTKLTHILSNSIGGDAKTLTFITVSGDQEDHAETFATLKFGKRVSNIVLREETSDEKVKQLKVLEKKLVEVEMNIEKAKEIIEEKNSEENKCEKF